MEEKKNILPQSELSDELLDGVAGGAGSDVGEYRIQCGCGISEKTYSKDLACAYGRKCCGVCGQKYIIRRA